MDAPLAGSALLGFRRYPMLRPALDRSVNSALESPPTIGAKFDLAIMWRRRRFWMTHKTQNIPSLRCQTLFQK
jgi:hypothetical protein